VLLKIIYLEKLSKIIVLILRSKKRYNIILYRVKEI
jgi:hypothetical protein